MTPCPRTLDEAAWYANGTLPASSRRDFESHLATCAECRAALALDARLAAMLEATAANVLPAPQVAWARLQERLDANEPRPLAESAPTGPTRETAGPGKSRLMQLAIAAQAATILLLVAGLWVVADRTDIRTFRTLGSGDSSLSSQEPLVRVVFAPGYSATTAREVALSAGAELRGQVEGTGIYTMAVVVPAGANRSERVAAVISTLRRRDDVLMAEPMTDPQVPGDRP